MQIDVWSDIACPWCYVGKRRLEKALASFSGRVSVTWRSFELNPDAPKTLSSDVSYAERLAKKYRVGVEQAEQMIARMTDTAKAEGLDFRFDIIAPGNTFDAHRLLHLAKDEGVQDDLKERLLKANFCEGRCMGDEAVLSELAREVGLAAERVDAVLAGGDYGSAVRADEGMAGEIGITGVPCFVFAGRYPISGAQSPETLVSVLEQLRGIDLEAASA